MKKLRLRKWVKVTLATILVITSVITMILVLDSQYKSNINNCIKAGNSKSYCEDKLR